MDPELEELDDELELDDEFEDDVGERERDIRDFFFLWFVILLRCTCLYLVPFLFAQLLVQEHHVS